MVSPFYLRRCQGLFKLTDEQRGELTGWARSRTLPAGDVFRARLILALAEGKSHSQIETELNTSRPAIARWKARFEQRGLAGLEPQHQGSQPRIATPAVQAKILRKTLEKLAGSSTHWACRKIATALNVSESTVQRVWSHARKIRRYIQACAKSARPFR